MADGIIFYKNKRFPGFVNCDETVNFTLFINNLFDSLNRRFPAEGIRKDSQDLQVFTRVASVLYIVIYM